MAAKIIIVSPPEFMWATDEVERLWFFPDGSEYLRYAPHFHLIYSNGFRQNLPLVYGFVVVLEGKLSVKDFYGNTFKKIDVRDQVWFVRGTQGTARQIYRSIIHNITAVPARR